MRLLLPGRHHLLTNHQLEVLTLATQADPGRLGLPSPIDMIVWAITSANHANTRRNPLPGHRREAAIEEFSSLLDVPSFIYHIDDIGSSDRFADYILKKIEVDSQGQLGLTPANTVVATATPEVRQQFARLGFRLVDGDAAGPAASLTPWQVLCELIEAGLAGADWRTHPAFLTRVSRASRRMFLKYGYDRRTLDLSRDPLGTEDGDLTATRDYNVYVRAFDEGAERKYAMIEDHVRPGRIVDIGCCTGSLIQQLTRDDRFRESDFYGVELARPLYQECLHRKEQGAFANDHVFFYQCNVADRPLFAAGSVDTFTTFSLTHELESYQGRAKLEQFIGAFLAGQLSLGGRWLNVDVVGPENKEECIYLWLNQTDGRCDDYQAESDIDDRAAFKEYLAGLSTLGRFLRFAQDFRRTEGYKLDYTLETINGESYAILPLQDACEFLSKKDYLDNWRSEMHETFCYWSFADWCAAVERAGLQVAPASRAFTNPWIVQHRYAGKVKLFRQVHGQLQPLDLPVTTMLLVAEKR